MTDSNGVTIVIPTLDEAGSIGGVIAEIRAQVPEAAIIVADGSSTDATAAVARSAGASVIEPGRGYGRACLAGAEAADAEAIVVFMEGDGADHPNRIGDLVRPLRAGTHDFVIGSRVRGPREPGAMAWHQARASPSPWSGSRAGAAPRLIAMNPT